MRFDATSPFQSAIWRNSGGFVPALVLILAALLVAARPARAAGPQAQPAAKQPRNARPTANQTAPPNAAVAPTAVPAQSAVQTTAPIAEQVLRQNLIQDPFRVAIDQAVQKGKQEAAANTAAKSPPKTTATQTTPVATGTAPPNAVQNGPNSTNPTPSEPPAVNGATNPNEPAAARLVCQGTRPATGAAYTLLFDPNANPAPAAGDACIPTGQPKAVGQVVMSSAPKTGPALAVVVPSTPAGGGNTSAAGPAAETLVCKGTRVNGAAFTFPFAANTSPAPTEGDACVPSGKQMPKGTAVTGTALKASSVFAVVFVPPSTAGGGNTGAAGSASERLVCQGTRPATGAAFTLLFDPNASPAPAAGDACIPTGQKMAKGTAVMSSQKTTGPALAVVFVPPTKAGGGNTGAAGPAAATLVCKGTRVNGAAFTFPFEANTSPAPAQGDACVPSGKKTPKGTAVMGTAPKASTVFAVVFVPPTTAGGGNTGAAGPAAATLVCKGTRVNGAAFTFPFEANTSPAPAQGDACVPSGKKMPKGTAVMGTAPKASTVFAVVFVPPTKAGGANKSAAGPAAATLVCKGTRANGAAFTFPFEANTSPAPAPGDACVPSGKKMPKGTAVVGTAPKAAKVFAVVFVPPTSHNTK